MNGGENISDSVPTDLFLEIFSRLPAKSIARFRCVSKLWGSMLSRPYFTELFLTRSSARPRILFAIRGDREWLFFSSLQPQNPYVKSSIVVAADFHMKISVDRRSSYIHSYASGLINFPNMWRSKEDEDEVPTICNPITGQYVIIPIRTYKNVNSRSFLGFDPIDKQFKVLLIGYPYFGGNQKILTLGNGKMRWRNIKCPLNHRPLYREICINGILYYTAKTNGYVIVCFDVRSEKFQFVDAQCFYYQLINYKGKLGGVRWDYAGNILEFCIWVLEDVEKHRWSKYVYTLEEDKVVRNLSVVGMTATCEIVLSMHFPSKPFYVFYFNLERNTLIRVEIQGCGEYFEALENNGGVFAFVDHVGDFNVSDTKQLKFYNKPKPKRRALCNSAPSEKNKQTR